MTLRSLTSLCLLLGVPVAAAADDDLVDRVRAGHRAARESIRTLTASMTSEIVHPTKAVSARGKYWRSGDVARARQGEEGSETMDFLMKGGEIRQVIRSWPKGQPMKASVARRPGNDLFCNCDVWNEMLITMVGPSDWQLSLDRSIETADGPVRADRATLDGRECIRLRYSHTYPNGMKVHVEQWHDIGYNYLIRQMVVEYASSPDHGITRLTDFIEPEPGVVFPTQCRREGFRGDELRNVRVTTLTDVVINKPLPAAALDLPAIPSGTELSDYIEGRAGPVDSNWKLIGPSKPFTTKRVRAAAAADGPGSDPAPSTSEPTSSTRWILIGSVGVLLLAAGLVIGRHLWVRNRPRE